MAERIYSLILHFVGIAVVHGFSFFLASVDLQCFVPTSVLFLDERKWFQFRRFEKIIFLHFNLNCLGKNPPSNGPTLLARLFGRVKL